METECPACSNITGLVFAKTHTKPLRPVHEFNAVDDHFFLVHSDIDGRMIAKAWRKDEAHRFFASLDLLNACKAACAALEARTLEGESRAQTESACHAIRLCKAASYKAESPR